jgi:hypothetical protein
MAFGDLELDSVDFGADGEGVQHMNWTKVEAKEGLRNESKRSSERSSTVALNGRMATRARSRQSDHLKMLTMSQRKRLRFIRMYLSIGALASSLWSSASTIAAVSRQRLP